MQSRDQLRLPELQVLDGGMASELEFLGADITGTLWSAHVLEDAPEKIVAVHRAYLEAGADLLLTASYQVSRQGYAEFGLSPERADQALLHAVELARQAVRESGKPQARIAASLGPYGAALHNGAEYHGNYECSFEMLVQFHQQRIAVLAESDADLLAFETIPSLEEAKAIAQALKPWSNLAAWLSFTCPDPRGATLEVAHGETLYDCAAFVDTIPQTVAIGVNCTQPRWITGLIAEIKRASSKPIVVYPNSGEDWDATHRHWTSTTDPVAFSALTREWREAGAQWIGGCCRTRPEHIRQISAALHSPREQR